MKDLCNTIHQWYVIYANRELEKAFANCREWQKITEDENSEMETCQEWCDSKQQHI